MAKLFVSQFNCNSYTPAEYDTDDAVPVYCGPDLCVCVRVHACVPSVKWLFTAANGSIKTKCLRCEIGVSANVLV